MIYIPKQREGEREMRIWKYHFTITSSYEKNILDTSIRDVEYPYRVGL